MDCRESASDALAVSDPSTCWSGSSFGVRKVSSQAAVFNQCTFPCLHSPASPSHSLSFSPASHHILHAVLCPRLQTVPHITSARSLRIEPQKLPRPTTPSLGDQLVAASMARLGRPKRRNWAKRKARNRARLSKVRARASKTKLEKAKQKAALHLLQVSYTDAWTYTHEVQPLVGIGKFKFPLPTLETSLSRRHVTNTSWDLRLPRRNRTWKLSVHLQPNGRLAATVGNKMGQTGSIYALPAQARRRKRSQAHPEQPPR